MDRKELMEVFNKRPRIGALGTCDDKGNVNVAVMGSPQMTDENGQLVRSAADNLILLSGLLQQTHPGD